MKIFQSILVICFFALTYAQELPPVIKFATTDYGGDNQNWMVSQDSKGFIYVANNKGLLEYNGSVWNTYQSPNNTILRAVRVVDNKIYTGCYEEFGYWERDEFGQLKYTSLIPKLDTIKIEEDQIWNIIDYEEWILFQSGHTLFFYNKRTESFKTITSENIIYKVFKIENRIYYHVANEGLYLIEEGQPKLINDNNLIIKDRVINVFEDNKNLIILTRNSGFFKLEDNDLLPWNIPANNKLKHYNVFTSLQLDDHGIMIGTISNGVIKINASGEIEYAISQKNGLSNNTVLSLFQDKDQNVWTGLDNGISCINDKSPIQNFIDYDGVLGTVYSTMVYNGLLYVGTNQGLFYKPLKSTNDHFKFVDGTAGQVWSLYNHNDEALFCGHHLGTFIIKDKTATKISSVLGAWNFKKIPEHSNLLLQGNYDGLYVLEKTSNTWKMRNKIEGFKNSSRYSELNNSNEILVNHEYKGVYRVKLDTAYLKATDVNLHSELSLSKNSSLITYKNRIIYLSEEGIYGYNDAAKRFERDTILSTLISATVYTPGKMIDDQSGRLWLFSKNNISYITNDNLTNEPEIVNIALPSILRRGVHGFENLQRTENDHYVLGTSNGYLTLDLPNIKNNRDYVIYLNSAKAIDLNGEIKSLNTTIDGELMHKEGIMSFSYSVPEYSKYLDVNYQYKLNGHSDRWSSWNKNANVQFENLSFGNYGLEVRARVGDQLTKNTLHYNFKVNRPWYISDLALGLYIITLIGIGFLVHKAYKFYYERIIKHEQIKNERAIIQIKNEKLNQDIESKNRELAISTMSIVKKNELLSKIKKELKTSNKETTESAINLIDHNLNNNQDWKFFKEAFNNADKDFLDKLKVAHSDLTPNDLKFCAYLRLNLSSKEIAPLLNISTKSVETKRYRLRKRLQLSHEESLVNYILKF